MKDQKPSFSLVEILVVAFIVGVLGVIGVPHYSKTQMKISKYDPLAKKVAYPVSVIQNMSTGEVVHRLQYEPNIEDQTKALMIDKLLLGSNNTEEIKNICQQVLDNQIAQNAELKENTKIQKAEKEKAEKSSFWVSVISIIFALSGVILGVCARQKKREKDTLEKNESINEQEKKSNKINIQLKIDTLEDYKDVLQVLSVIAVFLIAKFL